MNESVLIRLTIMFAGLSLLSIGGAPSVIPEMRHQVVDVLGWMDNRKFTETFALAQTAPGPNMMVVSLIGLRVAGIAGLAVSTLAILLPSSLLALVFGRLYHRFADAEWFPAFKAGLPPVVLGLLAASGVVTAFAAVHNMLGVAVCVGAALFNAFGRWNPLWALAAGVAIFVTAGRLGLL